jgi:hypothetical protein
MEENKEIVGTTHIKLCVHSSTKILPVLNVSTLDGLQETIEATGFSEAGIPVTNKQVKPRYSFIGNVIGYVDLTRIYRIGIVPNNTKPGKYKGSLIFGAKAVCLMLSRNGLSENPDVIEEKIANLVESGTIYFYKESATFHMDTATYGKAGYVDKWIISSKHPIQTTDKWTELLKKLHSDWRVKSKAVEKIVASRAIAELLK